MAGLYVHIPFCVKRCLYCDFVSFSGREGDFTRYGRALVCELDALAPLPAVDTIFFGGGTPSLPPPEFIPSVLDAIHARGVILPGAEITCEANPGTLTQGHIQAWKAAGVNRLSLGAQSAKNGLLAALGRIHRWDDVLEAAALWNHADSLSLDLMYGLPGQSTEDWRETLQKAAAIHPGHLSCYSLIVEGGTPLSAAVEAGKLTLPTEDDEQAMICAVPDVLRASGYHQYEVSNWARDGHICRHNMNVWKRGEYIGIGCAAASFYSGVRRRNLADLDAYLRAAESGASVVEEEIFLSEKDALFEELMLGLRLSEGVHLSEKALAAYKDSLLRLVKSELLLLDGQNVRLTARGFAVMNSVLVELMN